MHPKDKQIKNVTIAVLSIALLLSVLCIFRNPYYSIAVVIYGVIALANILRLRFRLLLFGILLVFGLPFVLIIEYGFYDSGFQNAEEAFTHFRASFIVAAILLLLPFFFIYQYFIRKVHWRQGRRYNKTQKIEKGIKIVGLVGRFEKGKLTGKNYYGTLWDYKTGEIYSGDYDYINILKNDNIGDYNEVITQIVHFFYNDVGRLKPINKIGIRIFGEVPMTESTKRLLERRFLKVEFIAE